MANIEKTLKLSIDDLTVLIERKYSVEVLEIKCSRMGIRCIVK